MGEKAVNYYLLNVNKYLPRLENLMKIIEMFSYNIEALRVNFSSPYYPTITSWQGRGLKIHGFWRKLTFFAAVFMYGTLNFLMLLTEISCFCEVPNEMIKKKQDYIS